MSKYICPIVFLFSLLFMVSCSDDNPENNIDNPDHYEFFRDGSSTVSFSGQTTRIAMATELINAMNDLSVSEKTLLEMYANATSEGGDANSFTDAALNASTKSIKSKVAASRDYFSSNTVESAEIKADIESWLKAQVSEVFPNRNQLASEGVAGQIADGSSVRYVNAGGLEYNQAVNKALIGALMVDQMLNNYLSTSVLDEDNNVMNNENEIVESGQSYTTMEHKWDEAYGYLFGAPGTSMSDPLSTLGEDSFLNKYLGRVEGDSDFSGIADDIYQAFKLGRAAIVAKNYDVRDQQVGIIRENISKVVAVRAVNYLQQGKLAIANNNPGTAFHDLSEGYGFVYSLRFIRQPHTGASYFTKSEVDGYLEALTSGNGFWDIQPAVLDQISEDIAERFDFTVAQASN